MSSHPGSEITASGTQSLLNNSSRGPKSQKPLNPKPANQKPYIFGTKGWTLMTVFSLFLLGLALVGTFYVFHASSPHSFGPQPTLPPHPDELQYKKDYYEIPMRDGILLATWVTRAIGTYEGENLPFLLVRSPYGSNQSGIENGRAYDATVETYRHLWQDGAILVAQDVRGQSYSQGKFKLLAPPCTQEELEKNCTDESTDAYDTIDWLINNIPKNNQRVGTVGLSYIAWESLMSLLNPHPALKAASPQASPTNAWKGDDFHTNGAFRLSVGFGYAALMQSGKTPSVFDYNTSDNYEFFRDLIPLSLANEKYFNGKNRKELWDEFMNNEDYGEHWQKRDFAQYLPSPTVPTMLVGGWWDAEDFYGVFAAYNKLLSYQENKDLLSLIVGPWYHGQWSNPFENGTSIGPLQFQSPTTTYFREQLSRSFFYKHLRVPTLHPGYIPPRPAPDPYQFDGKSHVFTTGDNKWNTFDVWPTKKATKMNLFFSQGGELRYDPTSTSSSCYTAYPLHPIPYTFRPIKEFWVDDNAKFLFKILDQRYVDSRPDLLAFKTDALSKSITLQGQITANFFATSTGTDLDWVIKLIDVYPDNHPDSVMRGYRLPIADTVLRAKYRTNLTNPQPLVPGEVEEFKLDLLTRSHTFLPGHAIMVQIASSAFPLISSNPQTFGPIEKATLEDYKPATHCILHSPQYPSFISLSILE